MKKKFMNCELAAARPNEKKRVSAISRALKTKFAAAAVVASIGFIDAAQAQTPRAAKPASPSLSTRPAGTTPVPNKTPVGVVVTSEYILGTEDQIGVASVTHSEIGVGGITIPADGKINLPLLGQFSAPGKTISKLQAEIKARMIREGFVRPSVTVLLTGQRRQRVYVLKSDGASGNVEITPGMRVSDVLALSNGIGADSPELTLANISRLGVEKPIVLDLLAIIRDSNSAANIKVQNGDTIRMLSRTIQISVAGSVARTGPVKIPIGSTLTEVMALIGGPSVKAALSRASLKRADNKTIIPVNLYDVLVRGKPAPDIELREGDLLLVPEAQDQVTVQGAVGRPGYFPIEDGRTLRISELIALAGGAREDASLTRTFVQRADGTRINVDLYRVTALSSDEDNILLQPDDIVTVPAYREQLIIAGTGVRGAGVIRIEEGRTMTILEALTQAGLIGTPEGVRITITRGIVGPVPGMTSGAAESKPVMIEVDPVRLYKKDDPTANIALQNGDLVMVTAIPREVFLSGQVRSPGSKTLTEGVGLIELLTASGGITETGLAGGVIVERDGKKTTIDVFGALTRGEDINYALMPGDHIIVPENLNRVAVMPGVSKPGYITIPEDQPLTLAEAMVKAGGPRDNSKLDEVVLLRPVAGKEMKPIPTPLKTSKDWIAASKIILKPGDIVYVPDRQPVQRASRSILQALPFLNLAGRLFGFGF